MKYKEYQAGLILREDGFAFDQSHTEYQLYLAWKATRAGDIEKAWTETSAIVDEVLDPSTNNQYLEWRYDPAVSEARKAKIISVRNWVQSVWYNYTSWRISGNPPVGDYVLSTEKCPYTFWDIARTP
jgi:hypothetical protein